MLGDKIFRGLIVMLLVVTGLLSYFNYTQNLRINSQEQALQTQSDLMQGLKDELTTTNQLISAQQLTFQDNLISLDSKVIALQTENNTRFVTLEEKLVLNETNIADQTKRLSLAEANQGNILNQIAAIAPGLAADKIYNQVCSSVVQITDGEYVYGSGFLHDKYGRVVTAAHVIEDMSDIYVVLSTGLMLKANVLLVAPWSDVAVLQVDTVFSIAPVTMGWNNDVTIGEYVLAIGHPLALNDTLTTGVISQVHRMENIGTGTSQHWIADLIQFDAPVNPGNSGGPLFNKEGQVTKREPIENIVKWGEI